MGLERRCWGQGLACWEVSLEFCSSRMCWTVSPKGSMLFGAYARIFLGHTAGHAYKKTAKKLPFRAPNLAMMI